MLLNNGKTAAKFNMANAIVLDFVAISF